MGLIWVVLILQALIFGAFAAFVASEKHRDPVAWFLLGALFSILAVIALIALPSAERSSAAERSSDIAVCPLCRERVQPDAVLCKHCHSDLSARRAIMIPSDRGSAHDPMGVRSGPEVVPACDCSESFPIVCPNCGETERIPNAKRTDPRGYTKFHARFSGFMHQYTDLRCRTCGTEFSLYPHRKGK